MIFLALVLALYTPLSGQVNYGPVITFDSLSTDLGTLSQKHPATVSFNFRNTGNEPLLIIEVRTSCSCSEPTFPKQPIMPGGQGRISVTYDAAHTGPFRKDLVVMSNALNSNVVLTITGKVVDG